MNSDILAFVNSVTLLLTGVAIFWQSRTIDRLGKRIDAVEADFKAKEAGWTALLRAEKAKQPLQILKD